MVGAQTSVARTDRTRSGRRRETLKLEKALRGALGSLLFDDRSLRARDLRLQVGDVIPQVRDAERVQRRLFHQNVLFRPNFFFIHHGIHLDPPPGRGPYPPLT
jgi:hypothetical protein